MAFSGRLLGRGRIIGRMKILSESAVGVKFIFPAGCAGAA